MNQRMNMREYIKRTAVRRVVWIVVGVVLYALIGWINQAWAQSGTSKEEAYNNCMAAQGASGPESQRAGPNECEVGTTGSNRNYWSCSFMRTNGVPSSCGSHYWTYVCPEGGVWNETTKKCFGGCENEPPLTNQGAVGSFFLCSGGCRYEQDALGLCLGDGATMWCRASTWTPTGGQCEVGDSTPRPINPNDRSCYTPPGGNYVHCADPNGRECVTTARGTVLCWDRDQTGPRMTGDGREGAGREKAPATPAPPEAMENPTSEGSSTSRSGGDTYNTNVFGGTGNTGGQANTGAGGSDAGQGGQGSGSGSGDGDGEGDGPGTPGGVGGDLYEGHGKTVGGVVGEFGTRMMGAPVVGAVTGFFTAPPSGGACPVWTIPATEWNDTLVFDFFCHQALQNILNIVGVILLAVAAFTAVHLFLGD